MKRTTYCGLVDKKYLDQEVTLKGWVQKRRDLGNLIFIDLRDREENVGQCEKWGRKPSWRSKERR